MRELRVLDHEPERAAVMVGADRRQVPRRGRLRVTCPQHFVGAVSRSR